MLARTLTLLLATAPLTAQFDFDLEKTSPAPLGGSIDLEVVGAPPTSILLYIPSATGGPTPLSVLDPADPRVVAVGADLLGAIAFDVTSPTGGSTLGVALPLDPAFHGAALHWQSITLLLGATFFGELSNDVVTQVGLPEDGVTAPNPLLSARAFSAIVVDDDNNNSMSDVLVTGGGAGTLTSAVGLQSTGLYDHRRMRVTAGPAMTTARATHLSIQLQDGRTLLIGGADAAGTVLASCEIYDPATNSFTPTGSMSTPRILHAGCLLTDGRVLVAGGTSTLTPDVTAAIGGTLNTAEIYDPGTGAWSGTANIGGNRLAPALTTLPNGEALLSGGVDVTFIVVFGTVIPTGAVSTTAVQRWSGGSWANGPNMAQGRAGHQYNQVTLDDGRVLMTGGVNVPSLLGAVNATTISGAEVYDPSAGATGSWSTFNMPTARALHTATVLTDGRVAVCGGAQGTLTVPLPISAVDVFDPSSNTWAPAPLLSTARASHVAHLMADGTLVLFGGQDQTATTASIETPRF